MVIEMAKGCTVSVIVPVYNAAQYLETCVGSIRRQTHNRLEILLMDDGSTDGSGRLCDHLAGQDTRIRVIHMENAGVSAARNRGIEEAKGDCLSFVDADDWIAPDLLEYLFCLMERTGCDVAGCGFRESPVRPEEGESRSKNQADSQYRQETVKDAKLLRGEQFTGQALLCGDTRCWSKLYRRGIIGTDRFETGLTIGEDMLFLLALAKKGAKFALGAYEGYFYFINGTGAMNRQFKDSYMDQITCWQRAYGSIRLTCPEYTAKAASVLMTAVMLTVGKLSLLPAKEWKTETKVRYLRTCDEQLKTGMGVRGAWKLLPSGYRMKTLLFRLTPKGYLYLYHWLKGAGVVKMAADRKR